MPETPLSPPSAAAPLLDVRGLSKRFGGVAAVRDVDLAVAPRSVHAVIGPNGAGKTSVFNCISSFVQPSGGTIRLDGERIDGLPAHVVARHGIARTYQNVRLFPGMTALENVLVGAHRTMSSPFWAAVFATPGFRREEAEARERAMAMLAFAGVERHAGTLARHLAYGDQRRLEIARAIVAGPKLLLLDEPAAGMNPAEGAALVELIRRIRAELGITVVLIEHHMRVVMAIADRITVIDRGAVLAEGTPAEIQSDDRVVAAYLGKRRDAADADAAAETAPSDASLPIKAVRA